MTDLFNLVSANFTNLALMIGGLFGLLKWIDQRRRELEQRRFEQYLKLIEISQQNQFIAQQNISTLLLRRFPEYKEETKSFLTSIQDGSGGWYENNKSQVEVVLRHLR
ncbi:MAG: hypothetical protein H7X92_00180 [Chitinophagales bacterium]|nr:hypothetical protein [Hyphomicrobiales bacterium]